MEVENLTATEKALVKDNLTSIRTTGLGSSTESTNQLRYASPFFFSSLS